MALSFSVFPLEIQEQIASSLSYKEIMALCHVETALAGICADQDFWRCLILKRYSKYKDDPKFTMDPQRLYRYLTENIYRIILRDKEKSGKRRRVIFSTVDEEIIAITIVVMRIYYDKQIIFSDQLRIIKPNGNILSLGEKAKIARKYYISPGDYVIQPDVAGDTIHFETRHNFLRKMFVRSDIRKEIWEHVLKLLHFLRASNITRYNIVT